VEYVSETPQNPFGMDPPCERYVPGYGDVSADFHVVGDHPQVHGGLATGVPFTGRPWSDQFFDALEQAELVSAPDPAAGDLDADGTFLSYLHMCDPGETPPDAESYAAIEPFFDAELRAITAHVLLPVGGRATQHVLQEYTARSVDEDTLDALHGVELHGAGWLVVPIEEPAEWTQGDVDRLVDGLARLRRSDYRRVSDLGRFLPDDDPYLVR
jgi:uracil-DNA glycosylase